MHCNFSAPVEEALEEGIRVLDVGCGTGLWTLEMAKNYPNSIFVGIDCEELFPVSDETPSNCTFLKANVLECLPFADGAFDYIFLRLLSTSFTPQDWSVAIRELTRLAKPGGWLESLEIAGDLERPPIASNFWELSMLLFCP